MKVSINHIEKSTGLVFKKKLHGVELNIVFSEEEKAVINERKIGGDILLERGAPADVDVDKHANRGLAKKLATAAIKGAGANHFHLTFNKLLAGSDTFWFETPIVAKNYEELLKTDTLPNAKGYIVGNATTGSGDSFEL